MTDALKSRWRKDLINGPRAWGHMIGKLDTRTHKTHCGEKLGTCCDNAT